MTDSTQNLQTLRDFVRWGASQFNAANLYFGHGTDNAFDEALNLVLHALSLPPNMPPEYLECRLTTEEHVVIKNLLCRRRDERCPAAYLTHQAWFAGLAFYVDERVLIPRSPFAELIEQGFQPWLDSAQVRRVLDLGTGSGCMGIATAVYLPHVQVDLVDILPAALEIAQRNLIAHGLEERVRVITSDLFNELSGTRYDLILANPPYVDAEDLAHLPAEYHHEPIIALAGGADGLAVVRRILRDARSHLTAEGLLFMEVGHSAPALIDAYPEVPFVWVEFARGGEGVCLLTAEQLETYASLFECNAVY